MKGYPYTIFVVVSTWMLRAQVSIADDCAPTMTVNNETDLCTVGQYKNSSQCCPCLAGKFNDDVSYKGYFSRTASCKDCPSGTYQGNAGGTSCRTCAPGKYSEEDYTSCARCNPGKHQDEPRQSSCKKCPAGYATNSDGSIVCDECLSGFYATEGSSHCNRCPAGYFGGSIGLGRCTKCQLGKHAQRKGLTSCDDCNPGNYQDATGQRWCQNCISGKYQPDYGKTSCIKADKGHYAISGHQSQAECPPGRYSSKKAVTNGYDCEGPIEAGRYSTKSGLTSESGGKKCPPGRFGRAGETHSNCAADCPAGYFCKEGTGEGDQQPCGGFKVYCPRGSSSPKQVPEGWYAKGVPQRQTEAYICQHGYYCQDSERFKCPEGRYGNVEGLTHEQCVGICEDGFYCPEQSESMHQQECAPDGDPLYYCQNGLRFSCDDGYTTPTNGSTKTRSGCQPCPHRFRCMNGRRLKKVSWTNSFCKYPNTRYKMFVRKVAGGESPQLIGEKLSTEVRVEYESISYWISAIVQDGKTLGEGKCNKNLTENSPIVVDTIRGNDRTFGAKSIEQYYGQLKATNGSTLLFTECGHYQIEIGITIVQTDINGSIPGTSAEVTEKCSFDMVVEFENTMPKKKDEYGAISDSVKMEVIRGAAFGELFGDPLSHMFTDPDGQELMFLLSPKDRDGNKLDVDENGGGIFAIGACTGRMKVNNALGLLEEQAQQITLYILVSDNSPDEPGELVQQVQIDLTQPNRPPSIAENAPTLFVVESSSPGTPVRTVKDPAGINITTLLHSAFVTDPDGDSLTVWLSPCERESYCNAFHLTRQGNLTVRDPNFITFDRRDDLARFVRVKYSDNDANPIETWLSLNVQKLRKAPRIETVTFSVKEDVSSGTTIGVLEASDNYGYSFRYRSYTNSITNNRGEEESRILVHSDGEIVKVGSPFNYILCGDNCKNCSEYDLWIDVVVTAEVVNRTDTLPGPIESDPATVRLVIEFVNKPPSFSEPSERVTVVENTEKVSVVDLSKFFCDREGDSLVFTTPVVLDSPAYRFTITTSGCMELESALDYEEVQFVNVTVQAHDTAASMAAEVNFPVYVIDSPEPGIVDTEELQVREHWTNDQGSFGNITVKDPDVYAGTDTLYSSKPSVFEIVQKTSTEKFQLTKKGSVYTAPGYVPDFENEAGKIGGVGIVVIEYSVVDVVNNVSATFVLSIRIIDVEERPYFIPQKQNFTINVQSNSVAQLGTVHAANEDFADSVVLELLEQPKRLSDGKEVFSVTLRADGRLFIAPGANYNITDEDVGTLFRFCVRASDSQGLYRTGTHFIEVANPSAEPTWIMPSAFTEGGSGEVRRLIEEHYTENDGEYDGFECDCEDPNQRGFTFQLLDIHPRFFGDILEINRNSGKLYVSEPELLDYETLKVQGSTKVTLELVCIDFFALQTNSIGSLIVEVVNKAEPPRFVGGNSAIHYSVREDEDLFYEFGEIPVFDQDFQSAYALTFKLVDMQEGGALPFETTSPVFEKDGRHGTVKLQIKSELDYLQQSSYEFKIAVEDEQGKRDERFVYVEVQFVNSPPIFNHSTFDLSVPESVTPEDVIATLEDFPFEDRAIVPYHTLEITWIKDYPDLLRFHSNRLSVASGKHLDYERIWFHELSIRITDDGGLTDEANVTLTVRNINDLSINSIDYEPHLTMGGSRVTLHGSDLGPVWRSASLAAIIRSPENLMVLESPCNRQRGDEGYWENNLVTCTVPAGVGSNLEWTLRVDEDSRQGPLPTRFQEPTVNRIEEWPQRALTSGGQHFLVLGENFGPKRLSGSLGEEKSIENAVTVEYKSKADPRVGVLQAANCHIAENDTRILCTTVEGGGSNLEFRANVGSRHPKWKQRSKWVASEIGYARPRVDFITPLTKSLPTTGLSNALRLRGVNFGPSDQLILVTMENSRTTLKPDCSRTNHTLLVCNLPEGSGKNFDFRVAVADQESARGSDAEAISYDPPTLESVTNVAGKSPRDLDTEGNDLVYLQGSNFGPTIKNGDHKMIFVYYGKVLEYLAYGCVVIDPHERVRCVTVEGIGSDHSWVAVVGKQWSNELLGVSNYHPPELMAYTRPNSTKINVHDMASPGNEEIVIHGRYFGPAGTQVDEVIYGNGDITFTAAPCYVLDHSVMHCISAPGFGSNHVWAVKIGGQGSTFATTAYAKPRIDYIEGVDGSDPQLLRTTGGELVDIVGQNFGPTEAFLESVMYGPRADMYTAQSCQVLSHSRIRCRTSSGHGQVHKWLVVISDQRSEISSVTTSYAPPVMYSISPNHGPTGFDKSQGSMPTLIIKGSDFGLNLVDHILVKVRMDTEGLLRKWKNEGKVEDRDDVLRDALARQQQDPSSWLENLDESFPRRLMEEWLDTIVSVDISLEDMGPTNCPLEYEQFIALVLPSGFGTNRPVFISVGDTLSLPVEFEYEPPRISQVSPSIDSHNKVLLKVYGENFCGGKSCAGSECCGRLFVDGKALDVSDEDYFHDEIRKQLDASDVEYSLGRPTGNVQVRVRHQPRASEEMPFKDPVPEIPNQKGRVQLSGFKTEGGEIFRLFDVKEVSEYYGDDDIDVKIGDEPCTNIAVPKAQYNQTTKTWRGNITCTTPPNIGVGLLVTLSVRGTEVPNPDLRVDYAPPVICMADLKDDSPESVLFVNTDSRCSSIQGRYHNRDPVPDQRLPTVGGQVVVEGDNLGSSDFDYNDRSPYIAIAGLRVEVQPEVHQHHKLEIPIPAGAGGKGETVVEATFLLSPSLPSFTFRYEVPNVERVLPKELPTLPGREDTVLIFGNNFGPPTRSYRKYDSFEYIPHVSVDFDIDGDGNFDYESPIIGSNHTLVECIPPEGQGNMVQLRITVDGQKSVFDQLRYKRPDIARIEPGRGPTSGVVFGDPVNVTIEGRNFGKRGTVQFNGESIKALVYSNQRVIFHLPKGFGEDISVFILPAFWEDPKDGQSGRVLFSYDSPVISDIYRLDGSGLRKDCTPFQRCISIHNRTECGIVYPHCLPTAGGVPIEVDGNNFGPPESDLDVKLFLGEHGAATEELTTSSSHKRRIFTLPQGAGKNLVSQICVGLNLTEDNDCSTGRLSTSSLVSYDPPWIESIMPNKPDAIGETLEFFGANFGPVGTNLHLDIEGSPCQKPRYKHGHTVITCEMHESIVGPKQIDMTISNSKTSIPKWLAPVILECKRGYYGLRGEMCLDCEKDAPGAVCPGGEQFTDLVYADVGWWRTDYVTPSSRCHPKRQNRRKCPVFFPCSPNGACIGNNTCAKQYAGFRCQDCAQGYTRIGLRCEPCAAGNCSATSSSEKLISACGEDSSPNCATLVGADSAKHVTFLKNSSTIDVGLKLDVRGASSRRGSLQPTVSVRCSDFPSGDLSGYTLFFGCGSGVHGSDMDVDLPIELVPRSISKGFCPGQEASGLRPCFFDHYSVILRFRSDASIRFRQQLQALQEQDSWAGRMLDEVPLLLIPMNVTIHVGDEALASMHQNITVDISTVGDSDGLNSQVAPDTLSIDTGRTGLKSNTSNIVQRSVVLSLDPNQNYKWVTGPILQPIVTVPPNGKSGESAIAREFTLAFDIEQAPRGVLESYIDVVVTSISSSRTLRVNVYLHVREGDVEASTKDISAQMSMNAPTEEQSVALSNNGDFRVKWKARLFDSDGGEVTNSASFWVKSKSNDFPLEGTLDAVVEQQTLFRVEINSKNVNSSGRFTAWLLMETDSRRAQNSGSAQQAPRTPDITMQGHWFWIEINLLVTSVFVCPERLVQVPLRPFASAVAEWTVVNVARHTVLVRPIGFVIELRLAEDSAENSSEVRSHSIQPTRAEGALQSGEWLSMSPMSAIIPPQNSRRFRVTANYPGASIRLYSSKKRFRAYSYLPQLRFTLSILTLEQWIQGLTFVYSPDFRKLALESEFLAGAATAKESMVKVDKANKSVGSPITISVHLADVFGNGRATAQYSSTSEILPTSRDVPLLWISAVPVSPSPPPFVVACGPASRIAKWDSY